MKKIVRLFIFLLLLVGAQSCTSDEHKHQSMEAEEQTYTCSMHPQVIEHKPGLCPICKMELTPVKKGKSAAHYDIELSEEQMQLGNISIQKIANTKQSENSGYNATLAYNQESIKTITTRAMGRIEKLYYKTTGEYIKAGQPVYDLYSEEIAIAKQDYINAYNQKGLPGDYGKNAEGLLKNARQKLVFYGLTDAQITALQTTRYASPVTTFYSNNSGYTTEILIVEGNYAMEGGEVLKLADLNQLWAEVQVYANQSNTVSLGQQATVTFPGYAELENQAKVIFINPEINPATRLLLVRLSVPNPSGKLKPGMQAMVNFSAETLQGLFVPTEAIIQSSHGAYLWVETEKGKFSTKMVKTGIETNGVTEIKSGLVEDEKVVITGAYLLNSEYIFRKGNDPMAVHKM
jgi:membrane fusion protein, copper/silver efflux system